MKIKIQIIYIALLSLFIFSCKKEKSDIYAEYSQADPIISGIETKTPVAEGKNVGKVDEEGVTEISKSDSISDVKTAFVKSSDGKYHYKFVLEKGKTYPLNTTATNTETTKFRENSMKQTSTSVEDLNFKVLQVQNENYKMEATFVDSKMTISGGGQSVTVSAKQPKPKEPMLQAGWMIQKARIGKKVTFQMDENGNISNVKGFDAILADIKKQFQTQLKGEELTNSYNMISQQVNGENFKNQVEATFIKFPKNGVSIGGSWTEKSGKGGNLTFTLTQVKDGKATVSVKSNYPPQSDQQSQNGITVKQSASMSTNGTINLDVNSGWIANAKLTDIMNQKEVASNGTETQTTSLNSTSITKINQ